MVNKFRLGAIGLIVIFSMFFAGCTTSAPLVESERPVVTLTGTVTKVGEKYFLKTDTKNIEITSRDLDLGSKSGMSVEVVGEYSGTTLYVDEMK